MCRVVGIGGVRGGQALTAVATSASSASPAAVPGSARTARPISRAISAMSGSVMPWVVTLGEPIRMPDAVAGGAGSNGIAFLFSVIRAASQRRSAAAPVTSSGRTSSSARWVSVPPDTARMPSASSPFASAAAFATTWAA